MYLPGSSFPPVYPAPALTAPRQGSLASDAAVAMPSPPLSTREMIDRLDARQDELIAKLDELNAQIEAALAEFGIAREKADAEEPVSKSRRAA